MFKLNKDELNIKDIINHIDLYGLLYDNNLDNIEDYGIIKIGKTETELDLLDHDYIIIAETEIDYYLKKIPIR